MNDMIHRPTPLVDLNQDDYEQGGEEEEEECGEREGEEESQFVHDVETGDNIKLPKGNRGKTWRQKSKPNNFKKRHR